MNDGILRFLERWGKVPLSWAGSTLSMDYANLGDALSPVMVALCTGCDVQRIPMISQSPRLAAVGTIGHAFAGGEVIFWGTGASTFRNPSADVSERIPYQPPSNTRMTISATRGPISEEILGGKGARPAVYGDPVWLLPRFYRPNVVKRWKLGVVLHLSELADRQVEAHPSIRFRRFGIPASCRSDIRLLNTVIPISAAGVRDKIDEILACERIVSSSLHGMVLAEAFGIPCLYFGYSQAPAGVTRVPIADAPYLDLRIRDLYAGLGQTSISYFNQPREGVTNWNDLIHAIDSHWEPKKLDEDRLIGALPLPFLPVSVPSQYAGGDSVFDMKLIADLELQHDVALLRNEDTRRSLESKPNLGNSRLRGGKVRRLLRRITGMPT
jgi:hypothetical protein